MNGTEMRFQSTLPAGEATVGNSLFRKKPIISIHASRGGSDSGFISSCQIKGISIHASRGGSDRYRALNVLGGSIFQSTLPAGEATTPDGGHIQQSDISIHASRGGSDNIYLLYLCIQLFQSTLPAGEATLYDAYVGLKSRDFNPRFPRGKRPKWYIACLIGGQFQSTLPAGEATQMYSPLKAGLYFNPRFPRGKRLIDSDKDLAELYISIHASRGGSDRCRPRTPRRPGYFNPRFPRGKRPDAGIIMGVNP